MFDLEDSVLSTKSFMNILLLNDYNIRALIAPNIPDKEILERINFPLIARNEVNQEEMDEITVVRKKEFDEKVKKARKQGFIEWINGHRKRRL